LDQNEEADKWLFDIVCIDENEKLEVIPLIAPHL
jgi:hypothetical protein